MTNRSVPLALARGGAAVRAVFLSGVDYWQRTRHGGHGWAMQQAVRVLLLVRQRLDAAPPGADERTPLYLPEEMWLRMCGFLRSADFPPFPPRAIRHSTM